MCVLVNEFIIETELYIKDGYMCSRQDKIPCTYERHSPRAIICDIQDRIHNKLHLSMEEVSNSELHGIRLQAYIKRNDPNRCKEEYYLLEYTAM
jgi:hypothetical protein